MSRKATMKPERKPQTLQDMIWMVDVASLNVTTWVEFLKRG